MLISMALYACSLSINVACTLAYTNGMFFWGSSHSYGDKIRECCWGVCPWMSLEVLVFRTDYYEYETMAKRRINKQVNKYPSLLTTP